MGQPEDAVRRLHIGGHQIRAGWEILDALPGDHVDHVCDARDLSCFADGTFTEIYASHVLEHFDYQEEIFSVLKEWYRVLRPGGILYISVPDLERLCRLYLAPGLRPDERFEIMRMMFGGHMDAYDYHKVGIEEHYLAYCLRTAGFVTPTRVESFGLFQDGSEFVAFGTRISLNVIAGRAPAA